MNQVPQKTLQLRLTAPHQPLRVPINTSFSVSADVTVSNISQSEVILKFDTALFDETSGHSNPHQLGGGSFTRAVTWQLYAKAPVAVTTVTIEARSNGLFQLSQFQVEII